MYFFAWEILLWFFIIIDNTIIVNDNAGWTLIIKLKYTPQNETEMSIINTNVDHIFIIIIFKIIIIILVSHYYYLQISLITALPTTHMHDTH